MEAASVATKVTGHLARNIILSVAGVLTAAVITTGIVFHAPLATLLGGNGKVKFKSPAKTLAYLEKNEDLYEITENADGNLSYRAKSGLGSVSVTEKDGKIFEVVVITDTKEITADTVNGVIDQVTELTGPVLGFIDMMTLAAHGVKEAENIPALTTDTEFTIPRTVGDYNVVVTKESGSDLVTAVFTR